MIWLRSNWVALTVSRMFKFVWLPCNKRRELKFVLGVELEAARYIGKNSPQIEYNWGGTHLGCLARGSAFHLEVAKLRLLYDPRIIAALARWVSTFVKSRRGVLNLGAFYLKTVSWLAGRSGSVSLLIWLLPQRGFHEGQSLLAHSYLNFCNPAPQGLARVKNQQPWQEREQNIFAKKIVFQCYSMWCSAKLAISLISIETNSLCRGFEPRCFSYERRNTAYFCQHFSDRSHDS